MSNIKNRNMKKLLLQGICLILMLAGAGCSEEEETIKSLILTEGTQTTQTVYADQTSGTGGGISFTATTDWTATVTDVTSRAETGSVTWLTLSQYSGGPGEYTLTLTLTTNLTGSTRKAQIEIRCGNDVITITVEQRAENADGNMPEAPIESVTYPAKVSKISYRPSCWSEYTGSDDDLNFDLEFKYDSEGRVAEYIYSINDSDYLGKMTTSFDYSIVGEIRATEKFNDSDEEHYTLVLGSNGYVSKMETKATDYNPAITYNFSYDETDHLSEITWETSYGSQYSLKYTYKNGAAEYTYLWYDDSTSGRREENENKYGTTPNNTLNIDPNILFESMEYPSYTSDGPECLDYLALLRFIGKRSDYYVSHHEDEIAYESEMAQGYPAEMIGKKIRKTYSTSDLDTDDLAYDLSENGRINSITKTEHVTKKEWEYYIKVLDRLLYPEDPERGYDYERVEGSDKLISTSNGTNTYTYTFTYAN